MPVPVHLGKYLALTGSCGPALARLFCAHYCSQIWPYIYIITSTPPHHHNQQTIVKTLKPNQMSWLDDGNAPTLEEIRELTCCFLDNWLDWKWTVGDRYNEYPGNISGRDCSIISMMTGGLSSSSSSSSPSWHAIVEIWDWGFVDIALHCPPGQTIHSGAHSGVSFTLSLPPSLHHWKYLASIFLCIN